MRKILDTRSSRAHYDADTFILWCFDDRFSKVLSEFQSRFLHDDTVKLAGGMYMLASGTKAEKRLVLDQIKKSIQLHHTKRIGIMGHIDCGMYGGSKKFSGHRAEVKHHTKELKAARKTIKKHFPKLKVNLYLADFDGLYQL
jgi:carbonic anhydrase